MNIFHVMLFAGLFGVGYLCAYLLARRVRAKRSAAEIDRRFEALCLVEDLEQEKRKAWFDRQLQKPNVFRYADRPRADDLKALGLKESDFTSPTRP